ncbi:phage head-tail joining protein [Methylocystis parvus]|uniref:phage head-tail joining protein n=1 Tax=Methylocystis parvus TaxID=134 RepID=UPI003C75F095
MTPDQIDATIGKLETALASGVLTVEYDGRRTTFSSAADLIKSLDYFKRLKAGVPSTGPAPASADRGSYAAFSRD